ncbi:MAG: hypothetical protein IPK32_00290 [Verrucomicrobiaceae bacterium]|nr:hypothetical protein [Verrucomicrobiaceae bacterium]
MKKVALTLLALSLSLTVASAGDATKDAMKKYHKPEDAICKKVGKGEASSADLSTLLKCYEAMKADTPAKGDKFSWEKKTDALISAIKKVQGGDKSGIADYKKAVNCKACHDVHKGK